ncbi:YlxR family protein [bacterium]|nr:YlxR family protein [bacterium]
MAERSCFICKTKREKQDLIRIIIDNNGLALFDLMQKIPQRSAYICYNTQCIDKAEKMGREKGLGKFSLQKNENLQRLKIFLENRVKEKIRFLLLSKKTVIGLEETLSFLTDIKGILFADDLSENTLKKLNNKSGDVLKIRLPFLTKEDFGTLVNKSELGVLGVKEPLVELEKICLFYENLFSQEH